MLSHSDMKILIETADNVAEADAIVSKSWCSSDADKLYYVKQLFGDDGAMPCSDSLYEEYICFLSKIVGSGGRDDFKKGYRRGYDAGFKDSDPDELWVDICRLAAMSSAERERRFGYPYMDLVVLGSDLAVFKEKMETWKQMEGRG